ncbi:hypothetical protein I6E23_04960 [Prevotella brevis]|nr:hypothetical protein [Xylanibacter brevis]
MIMKTISNGNNYYIRTMKKYILPFMSIAMLMAMASCSSSDDEVAEIKEESKLVPMTFTATQESNVGTRTALNAGTGVDWETGDKISVFDGQGNRTFTLTEDVEDGKFSGTASSQATSFTAVYPYTEGAKLEKDGSVSGITLPAEQTATLYSFDPKAALMMAVSTKDKKYNLDFKNAVSLIKLQIEFACKKIVLTANEDIAGTGTLTYNNGEPSISFTSNQSKTITLKPATGEYLKKGQYFIVVPPITLTEGFSISFHASEEYCVYTRTSTKSNTFNRSKFKHIGKFETTGIFDTTGKKLGEWTYNSRGIVDKSQELDMGEFEINGKKYRLIFAKSNLTKDGLATNEYDYGDYFAWGATSVWYSAINQNTNPWSITPLGDKPGGYTKDNAPYYYNGKYTSGNTLEAADDAARQILKGDWQIPTKEIWMALEYANHDQVYWGPEGKWTFDQRHGINGISIVRNDGNDGYGKLLFLPAAGRVSRTEFQEVGSIGDYWSGTAYTNDRAYNLQCKDKNVTHNYNHYHSIGLPVRPVRLVAVD